MITTDLCDFNKETGDLTLSSHHLPNGWFPRSLQVKSVHTGRIINFTPIGREHPRFDEDGWDGEMALYVPDEPCNVKLLTLYHGM